MAQFSLPEVGSMSEVPAEYRAFYFEKDGKVQRQNPQAMASTVAKVKRENERLASELLEREARLEEFIAAFGEDADLDEIKTVRSKAAKFDETPSAEEIEKRIAEIESAAKKQKEELEALISQKDKIIDGDAVMARLELALHEAKGGDPANTDGLSVLPHVMKKRVEKKVLENGRLRLVPLDEGGSPMKREDGTEASMADLVGEFRAKWPMFFGEKPKETKLSFQDEQPKVAERKEEPKQALHPSLVGRKTILRAEFDKLPILVQRDVALGNKIKIVD